MEEDCRLKIGGDKHYIYMQVTEKIRLMQGEGCAL